MAKDIYHIVVRKAIEKIGWLVTHDPYSLSDKETHMDYDIDLGAEKLIAAEKGTEKIAIEVKSFLKASLTHEFHSIFGQYLIYTEGLKRIEPDRILYLAVPKFADARLVDYPFLLDIIEKYNIKIIVFDEITHEIISWKK